MTDYATRRDAAYVARLQPALEEFASQFGINANSNHNKPRTIFLFPGGIGSQLMRSYQPYPDPPQSYEKVWFDLDFIIDGPRFALLPGGIDTEQKYVIPDGCVDIPGPYDFLHPYAVFIQWCRQNSIDLFVFGWDWRRSVQDAADFFLNIFLPMFDARFGHTPHPLDHFSLVGHSAGGMVIKAILNSTDNQYVRRIKKAITVSTPFYGYGDQIRRYLKGDPLLNSSEFPRSVTTKIISSMPGLYEYLYLDYPTYLANQRELAHDPEEYNLTEYPSMDYDDPTEVADPYDPQLGADGTLRYPLDYGFESSLLYRANSTARNVSRAITDPAIAGKFYNIRGVKSSNGTVVNSTAVSISWKRISSNFDPDEDPDPIEDKMGPGDGTQPAWTARLLGLPAGHVITIVGDEIEHLRMMNLPRVQSKIAELLGLDPGGMMFAPANITPLAASLSDFKGFLDGLRRVTAGRDLTPERRNVLKTTYLRTFTPEQLQLFLARYLLEAQRQPSETTEPPRTSQAAPVQRGPAPQK
jgi:pimeloyl-ACP methyl ester carboxylesterase